MARKTQIIIVLTIGFVLAAAGKEVWADCVSPSGYTCVCNSGETKWVCAKWGQGAPPEEPADFTVNYGCDGCADAPNIELREGDGGWELYSEVKSTSTPANLGSITVPSSGTGNFGVKIAKGTSAGAVNVGNSTYGINLTLPSTSNYSNLTGANITGTLSGISVLQKSSGGSGGDISGVATIGTISGGLVVQGNLLSAMTVTNVNGITQIGGTLGTSSQSADLNIGTLAASFSINGTGTNYGDMTVTTMSNGGSLTMSGNVPSGKTITIGAFSGGGSLGMSGQSTLAGRLELPNGIAASGNVVVNFLSGTIDLNNMAVNGILWVSRGESSGTIIDGGAVGSTGIVYVGYYPDGYFHSTADFDSVALGGVIQSHSQSWFGGYLTVTNAVAGDIRMTGASYGTIDVGSVSSSGRIILEDEDDSHGSDIIINGNMAGVIDIDGGLLAGGGVFIDGALTRLVDISGGLSGSVNVSGNISGTVEVSGGMDQDGDVISYGTLTSTGRITVNGLCDGTVQIANETVSGSRIQLVDGLGATGNVLINMYEGNYNANGNIYIGPLTLPNPPNNVEFDGCIRIYKQSGSSSGGDLYGSIVTTGCHDDSDPLSICVDGGNVFGRIQIVNSGCSAPEPSSYSCGTCP